jgi:hypothetical protein
VKGLKIMGGKKMKNENVEVVFIEEREPLKIFELSNFLYHIKILYSWLATSEEFGKYWEEIEPERIKSLAQTSSREALTRGYPSFPNRYGLFRKDLKNRDVFVAKMYKESPLTIWFMGISTFLAASFILCGGEIELSIAPPRVKIKMSCLGKGIKKLKEAIKR